jgi:formylmethanofuran dehydrogenase subunit C
MTLVLESLAESSLPIEVEGITPEALGGLSEQQIATREIWLGRKKTALGELFRVQGTCRDDATIVWEGNLNPVHWIGADMSCGNIVINGDAGRHVGSRMSGGTIVAESHVSDFAGSEMTGGTLRIKGNAGDLLGGNDPGSKFGMNRGTILVEGNVGKGAGQSMRRGTIVIGGAAGKLSGWHMLGGTILVFGEYGADPGANMTRGTIVLAGPTNPQPRPTFARGSSYQNSMMAMLDVWLQRREFESVCRLSETDFQMYHGDLLNGGRGELFIVEND